MDNCDLLSQAFTGSLWLLLGLSLSLSGSHWLSVTTTLALTATLWHTLALSGSLLLSNFAYTALDRLTGPLLGSHRRCHDDALYPALVLVAAASSMWRKVFAPQCKPFPTCWNSVKAPPVTSLDFYQELFLRQPVCVFLVILFQSLYSNEERFIFTCFYFDVLQCVWGNVFFSLSVFAFVFVFRPFLYQSMF